ncbi:MAG TPA: hypothetical protein VFQ35_27785, partial [Polyangiaceae bacterium]|nr:hypothetical protein [Polyangiaceae bacterium]
IRLCRCSVPADAFKPLTTDPLDRAQFYAVLKFGDSCPKHAVEVTKVIVNEDQDTQNAPTNTPELLYPNEIVDRALGNFTRLVFCYFRNAPSADDTMSEFPDLGVSYAVFHDFEGPQPGWVIRKRWQLSDDSNTAFPGNAYYADPPRDDIIAGFMDIIENPVRGTTHDTYFDMARVR